MTDRTYTRDEIIEALNRAADDIIEAAELPDVGARDAINLLVNVVGNYIGGDAESGTPSSRVRDVIAANYSEDDPDEVLSWLTGRG